MPGQDQDTSVSLTLHDAGSAIAGLLSDDISIEDKQPAEAKSTPEPVVETDDDAPEPEALTEDESQVEDEGDDDVDDDEEIESAAPPEPRKLKVKLPDGEQELPEDEVVNGYLRTADYTRKTQKLADERKAFEAEAQAVAAERQRYAAQLAQLDELLTDTVSAEPDWDTLKQEDPAVFAATYAAWDQQQKQLGKVRAERARAEQQVQADYVAQMQNHLRAEATKLVEAIPEWKDPEKAKADRSKLVSYAETMGYTPDELAQVTDHRVIRILRDAALYRDSLAKKPAIEQKIERVKVQAPGSSVQPKVVSRLTRKKQRLAKTGSLRDAGAVIAELLDD